MALYWLSENLVFPDPEFADDDGMLALGGDLSVERLLLAYHNGIFPWYNEGEPIVWWSPNPRFVLFPQHIKVSKSMRNVFNRGQFTVTFDQEFRQVMQNCQSAKRKGQEGETWITEELLDAYCALHQKGFAHSVEVWKDGELVGGLYGISLGTCFFGESMFAKVSNASKVGFITLVKKLHAIGFQLIDCQMHTPHLESLGGQFIPRVTFNNYLRQNQNTPTLQGNWGDLLD